MEPRERHHFDFSKKPFLVIWETTHACELACVHCRAAADLSEDPLELTHEEGLKLIRDVKAMGTPILIFSGGDPLRRKDLAQLISSARAQGLRTGAIPAVTPALAEERILELKAAGLSQIAFSLDSARFDEHDSLRRTVGVYERTLRAVQWADACGLAVQINSLVNVHNLTSLGELIALIETLPIVFWEVFFLVPIGRGKELELLVAEAFEEAFQKIYELNRRAKFIVKVTEAPHYRRFYYEKEMRMQGIGADALKGRMIDLPADLRRTCGPGGSLGQAPQGVNAGKGFLFISHKGEIMPSGFLPIVSGDIRKNSLSEIYQNSKLFQELRDASLLKGRCGICPYREICGGSRSRAYALTGDYLAEDPCCLYQPDITVA